MDDKLAQATPSAAYTRPQQPADSPIAALPFETLQHILQLARGDSSPPEAARTLNSFSRVCKLWHDVAQQEGRGELLVASSQQAERLTKALLDSPTTAWQRSIRAVVVQVERSKTDADRRSKRVGDFLLALPRLERLYLELEDALGINSTTIYRNFGNQLFVALQAANSLTHFHLELGAEAAQIDIAALYTVLSRWPNLRSFTAPSLESRRPFWPMSHPAAADLMSTLPKHLQPIHIARWISLDSEGLFYSSATASLLLHLLVKSSYTIRSLQLGAIPDDLLLTVDSADARSLGAMLEDVAPRLRLLDIRDGPRPDSTTPHRSDYLVSIIEKLAPIRTLTLGLAGVPLEELFPLLGRLTALDNFSLVSNQYSYAPHAYSLDPPAATTFITKSTQLRSLKLPSSHCAEWSADERKAVEGAAEAAGVLLSFA